MTDISMDMLLKMPIDDFVEYVKTKDLGFKKSLSNLLALQYEQANKVRHSLVTTWNKTKEKQGSFSDEKELEKTVGDLFVVLQLLEDRFCVVKELL